MWSDRSARIPTLLTDEGRGWLSNQMDEWTSAHNVKRKPITLTKGRDLATRSPRRRSHRSEACSVQCSGLRCRLPHICNAQPP